MTVKQNAKGRCFMKQIKRLSAVLLTFIMVFSISGANVVLAQNEPPVIRVTGAGSITALPDFADVILGVETTARTPQEAVEQNNAILNDVLAAVRALGIADDDIVTHQFNLSPARDFMTWQPVEGHVAFNSVSVRVNDLDMLGYVLGAGIDAGASLSGNVRFGLNNPNALYYEALAIAITDAENKANAMARAMGVTVTGVVSATETNTWTIPVLGRSDAGGFLDMQHESFAMTASGMHVPIQSGEITITARVEIAYSISR